jgi:thioredoxin 1
MKNKAILIALTILVVLVGAGGAYAIKNHNDSIKTDSAMMAHENAMKHDAAMKQTDSAKSQLAIATTPSTTQPSEAMMQQEAMMAMHGTYITLSDYTKTKANFSGDKKVLFFHAPWCPTCQSIDKAITSNPNSIPAKTVIIKTDYDTETALKQTYGVTQQYTFVQFDNNGNLIKKWSASTLADVLSQIQQ